MDKVLLSIHGLNLVVAPETATKVIEALDGNFEIMKERYNQDADPTFHIYRPNAREVLYGDIKILPLPDNIYQVAKLAGRPPK